MKKRVMIFTLAFLFFPLGVQAGEMDAVKHDDFGGAYFTATTPDALQDKMQNNVMVAETDETPNTYVDTGVDTGVDTNTEDTMLSAAEALGSIEPAAGGDSIFILPDDDAPAAENVLENAWTQNAPNDVLTPPETAIIPGMDSATASTK